jgi:hypothetical protein
MLCYVMLGKSDHAVLQFDCKINYLFYENLDKLNYGKGDYVNLTLIAPDTFWRDASHTPDTFQLVKFVKICQNLSIL